MRNIWTIANREYKNYFSSPVAYVVAFVFLVVIGIIFILNLLSLSSSPFGAPSAPDARIVTGPMGFLLILAVPALTMRTLADESRMGTLELLLTAPLRDFELVLGKWLGAFLFMLTLIIVSLIFPLILNSLVSPGIDQLQMIAGYLGVILVTAALLGLGVGISAMFNNPIASFFTTLSVYVLLWWLIGAPANILQSGGGIFTYLDMSGQFYNNFIVGTVTLSGIVYYLSLTSLGLFLGSTFVEMRRWR